MYVSGLNDVLVLRVHIYSSLVAIGALFQLGILSSVYTLRAGKAKQSDIWVIIVSCSAVGRR